MREEMSGPIATPITNAATRDLWKVAETGEIGQLIELLTRGADVNASNQAGVTALMVATLHGRLEMVRALTDHGADVNATDRDGFSAAMLAEHAHREDIVRLLVARGARRIPKQQSPDTPSRMPAQHHQTTDSSQVNDAAETRTLDQPPNIWDVVQETHVAFDPQSAFFGRLKSINPYVYALVALIVGGGAVLGFISLGGWSGIAPAPSGVKTESSNNQISPSAPANAPDTNTSSDQKNGAQTTEPAATESSSSRESMLTPAAGRLASTAANAKLAVPTPTKRVAVKHSQPDRAIAPPVGGATPTSTDNIDNPDKATAPTTPTPGSDNKKSVEPIFTNKDPVKAPSPPPVVPAKVRPTPNR
jgi:hypothetical protein